MNPHRTSHAAKTHSVWPRHHRHVQNRIVLYTGDVATSASPAMLETLLGSCVAVCLFDPKLRIGGMNHILLPEGGDDVRSARFGMNAMELLINQLMKAGSDRRSLVAKAFGGASVFASMSTLKVGAMNAEFVREYLRIERIPLVAQRLGGEHAVHVYFHTETGKAVVRTVDGSALPKINQDEAVYRHAQAGEAAADGEVTLF